MYLLWRLFVIAFLAVIAGTIPFVLGMLLGFAAFLATPVVMVGVLIAFGAAIARTLRDHCWSGIALATIIVAPTAVLLPFVDELLVVANGDIAFPFWPLLRAVCLCGAFLALGAWLFAPATAASAISGTRT